MKYSEATLGRVFLIRLEPGDVVSKANEALAREKKLQPGGRCRVVEYGGIVVRTDGTGGHLVMDPETNFKVLM